MPEVSVRMWDSGTPACRLLQAYRPTAGPLFGILDCIAFWREIVKILQGDISVRMGWVLQCLDTWHFVYSFVLPYVLYY